MTNNSTLHACKLNKGFIVNNEKLDVLKEIEFIFNSSQSYSIVGISGTGKSTLINLLSGVDRPTTGTVLFNKIDIHNLDTNEKNKFFNESIGIVFQSPYLIQELTVFENVMLKGLISKKNYNECKENAIDLLAQIGLKDKAYELPGNLSIGQQQRVSILRAIFNKPKFLLADEPTANLDRGTANCVTDLLLKVHYSWKTGLIITTHDKVLADTVKEKLEIKNSQLIRLR